MAILMKRNTIFTSPCHIFAFWENHYWKDKYSYAKNSWKILCLQSHLTVFSISSPSDCSTQSTTAPSLSSPLSSELEHEFKDCNQVSIPCFTWHRLLWLAHPNNVETELKLTSITTNNQSISQSIASTVSPHLPLMTWYCPWCCDLGGTYLAHPHSPGWMSGVIMYTVVRDWLGCDINLSVCHLDRMCLNHLFQSHGKVHFIRGHKLLLNSEMCLYCSVGLFVSSFVPSLTSPRWHVLPRTANITSKTRNQFIQIGLNCQNRCKTIYLWARENIVGVLIKAWYHSLTIAFSSCFRVSLL